MVLHGVTKIYKKIWGPCYILGSLYGIDLKISPVSCQDKRSSLTTSIWDFCSCHTGNRAQKTLLLLNIFYQKVSSVEIHIHTMGETRNSRMVYTTPIPPPSCFGYDENHTELKVISDASYGSEFTRTFEHAHFNLIIFINVKYFA